MYKVWAEKDREKRICVRNKWFHMDYKAEYLRKPTKRDLILIGMACIQTMSFMIACFEKVKSNCNYLDLLLQYQI